MSDVITDLVREDLSICFTPSKRKKVSKVFISIEGSLVIDAIDEVKESLLPAIKHYEMLAVSLSNISKIDVAGIQLLHYLSGVDNQVTIDSNLGDDHRRLISISGFSEFLHKPKLV